MTVLSGPVRPGAREDGPSRRMPGAPSSSTALLSGVRASSSARTATGSGASSRHLGQAEGEGFGDDQRHRQQKPCERSGGDVEVEPSGGACILNGYV